MSNVRLKQLDLGELTNFIIQVDSGNLSSALISFLNASGGYVGGAVIYSSGDALISGTKTFANNPILQYSGGNTSAVQQQYFLDTLTGSLVLASGVLTGNQVQIFGNQSIFDRKIFTGALGVGTPITTIDAVNLAYLKIVSGVLSSGAGGGGAGVNSVDTFSIQTISGQKTFTVSPLVVSPTDPSGAANKAYVDAQSPTGVMHLIGDETANGIKTFVQSPLVPIATLANQAVPKQQLDSLGVSIGGLTGFAGVSSLNGSTGAASGAVYLVGAGTVSVLQCGAIFYVSGLTPITNQLYGAQIPLPSGITGLSFTFPTGLVAKPIITDALEVMAGNGGFFDYFLYNLNSGGFNVAFQSGIPNNNYLYHFHAIPVPNGSGFAGLQGQPGPFGPSINPRGAWGAGNTYNTLDLVYANNFASYLAIQTHVSTVFNAPTSTGNAVWNLMSSGVAGPTGYWSWQGNYNNSAIYVGTNSVFLNGTSYGYTGANPISNVSPDTLTGGWTLIAEKGNIGYFINSGIITGNYTTLSFYFDPIATGLAVAESFISRNINITGFALGAVISGAGPLISGGMLSGRIYARNPDNSTQIFQNFTFDSGLYYSFSGNLAIPLTGNQRIGLDILSTLSGIQKFSVGVFGFGIS